jgi:hypothetical protein
MLSVCVEFDVFSPSTLESYVSDCVNPRNYWHSRGRELCVKFPGSSREEVENIESNIRRRHLFSSRTIMYTRTVSLVLTKKLISDFENILNNGQGQGVDPLPSNMFYRHNMYLSYYRTLIFVGLTYSCRTDLVT